MALELCSLRDPALQANYFPFCFCLGFHLRSEKSQINEQY